MRSLVRRGSAAGLALLFVAAVALSLAIVAFAASAFEAGLR